MEGTKQLVIEVKFFVEPKTMKEQNINMLAESYENTVRKLQEEYNTLSGQINSMSELAGNPELVK